jgi:GH25 family lysozyme M1 (1,4-beta-N-acetylmuramidase)
MNKFLQLIDYYQFELIRFGIIIVGISILIAILLFIIRKFKNKQKSDNPPLNDSNKERFEILFSESNQKKSPLLKLVNYFKNYKVLLFVILIQFVILVVLGYMLNYEALNRKKSEIKLQFEILRRKTTEDLLTFELSKRRKIEAMPLKDQVEDVSISRSKYLFGIDISHYQEKINWNELRKSHHPIKYIFIKATEGLHWKDPDFESNWINAKKHNYLRGAYHFYRPDINSTKQFNNFAKNVKLKKGDLRPVLDIEIASIFGKKLLRKGILNWLKLAEKKYGIKPIIYTNQSFYEKNLKGYVDGYPLWIAAYSGKHKLNGVNWTFHQFTEFVKVKGIKRTVDGNDFKGGMKELRKLCLKK